jgi:very-short-patch-repair endonuclease
MARLSRQSKPDRRGREAWDLAARQHGVITRGQLHALGFGRGAVEHRVAIGRLHQVLRGVYAVGRPSLTREGRWMAAVLACGPEPRSGEAMPGAGAAPRGDAAPPADAMPGTEAAPRGDTAPGDGTVQPAGAYLSHGSAAALLGIGMERMDCIEVSVRSQGGRRRPGIRVHRRRALRDEDVGFCKRIPVTSPARTIVDLAARLDRTSVERMVDEADRLDLLTPPALRAALERHPAVPGVARLRTWLDRRTFRLTRSHLERLFLPMAGEAGLPVPETKTWVNGFEVDFLWPDLRLVVETDSLRHHRTVAEQARDRLRDQAHTAAGYAHLRFTHEQVRYEREHVLATLRSVARRLRAGT